MKEIKNFKGLKLFPEEEILNIQRQHWILILPTLVIISLAILAVIAILISLFTYQYIQQIQQIVFVILLAFVFITFLLALVIYLCLQWYYQIYIITTKRLVHIHFFRIAGFHLDEVLHEQTRPIEIDRNPENFIFNILEIEDVYVYFKRLERPDPFIFKTPHNSNVIVDILENHLLKK